MLWVMVTLAGCELVGVHLLLSLWSHTAAWVMSAVTVVSVAWLVRWIMSWKRLPHELHRDRLRLHMGSLRHVDVPIASIERITGELSAQLLTQRDTRRLVPLAYPNRLIELRSPLPDRRATRRIAFRIDDPAGFDAAMSIASAQPK